MPEADNSGVVVIDDPVEKNLRLGGIPVQVDAGKYAAVMQRFQRVVETGGQILLELRILLAQQNADDIIPAAPRPFHRRPDGVIVLPGDLKNPAFGGARNTVAQRRLAQHRRNDPLAYAGKFGDPLLSHFLANICH